ncbi:MAG: SUMF1/EgtB/PvdO family nonheme iron enzyme, partial [Bacteroidetes bacterium]|nr:SUMF1/EgtB/PvdO family nonheme iron enzyme [Bacteroidota bacterium]
MRINRFFQVSALIFAVVMATGCKKDVSRSTGWEYNNPKNGGFEKPQFTDQITGPGLVFIEGGTFTMGNTQDDVMFDWNNSPRRITVSSFYMDQTEVSNLDYLEYLYWLNRVYATDYPGVYRKALPDSLVWRQKLAYNEPLLEYY